MELAINEVKIQAKKLLKTLKSDEDAFESHPQLAKMGITHQDDLQLKHTLTIIAITLGFKQWQQASAVLSGQLDKSTPQQMGTLFYPKAGHGLTNEWFADYQAAKTVLDGSDNSKWLFPYKNQFIVVDTNFLAAFRFDDKTRQLLSLINRDMAASYNCETWDKITCAVIKNR